MIDEGVTGFVVDDEEEAVQAVKRLAELERRRVRERFEERFTGDGWLQITARITDRL